METLAQQTMAQLIESRLLYVSDVAKILNLSEVAVRIKARAGQLPSRKWNRTVVFFKEDIEKFLEDLRNEP